MSVIGSIGGVPLFTKLKEALDWAAANGLSGYHTHELKGIKGSWYMGGANHGQATNKVPTPAQPVARAVEQPIVNRVIPVASRVIPVASRVEPIPRQTSTTTTPSTTTSSSGGGGGY